jgi:phosphatidylglycerol:prolipoprotein diacylglycerol transferase
MGYAIAILAGALLSLVVRRLLPSAPHRYTTQLAAIALIGALSGAMLLEMPADWFGWTSSIAGQPVYTHGVGGRTVLGGILGGWIAVDLAKPALGIRVPTGDGFAAPLAAALACGRVGCALTGCCAGKEVTAGAWWSAFAVAARDGVLRFPAAIVECVFHAVAAVVLIVVTRRGLLAGRTLAAYVAVYCLVRVALEEVRDNPAVVGRWTYYQMLALPLLVLAVVTLVRRSMAGAQAR